MAKREDKFLRPHPNTIKQQLDRAKLTQMEIGPVEAVAKIWSAVVLTKTHSFNHATNNDALKIIMKNEWEHNRRFEFSVTELIRLWNEKDNGKTHTRAQCQNTLQALKAKGHVTVTCTKPKADGGSYSLYGLTSVIDVMTNPGSKEEPAIEPSLLVTYESEIPPPVGPSIDTSEITRMLKDMHEHWANSMNAITGALNVADNNTTAHTEAFNELAVAVKAIRDVSQKNIEIANNNAEEERRWGADVMNNFGELEGYFKRIEMHMGDSIARLEQIYRVTSQVFSSESPSNEISAWKSGYKEGHKDGRESYQEELRQPLRKELG